MKDSWLEESPGRVLARARSVHNLTGGGRVEIRAEENPGEITVIFARERAGQFPGWAQGSWVFIRSKDTGAVNRIRVFPRSDPNTYIQFRPFATDKCQMDVVLYNAYIVRSMTLPVTLERMFSMPLTDVINLAGNRFPRRYFEPNPADYRNQRVFVEKVREQLPDLRFADDGAMNEEGSFVYIKTGLNQEGKNAGLNCSGFAKWLIDGILKPVTGERLAIPPLKAPFGNRGSSVTDPWEELRDPFFGLDWIRNLASQAGSTLRSPAFGSLEEIEVRKDSFSMLINRNGSNAVIKSYPGFLENAGYSVEGLQPLLYTLAIDEPGRFFLAAVNNETGPPTTPDNPRGRPRMRQYFHVAAFVPYFTETGVFQVAVFESAAETSLNAFRNRYTAGQYVSLVRVPVETAFDP